MWRRSATTMSSATAAFATRSAHRSITTSFWPISSVSSSSAGSEQDAICDKLVRNCLYNFREAMRRRHAPDFAEAVADMRRKLARMYEVKAQLPPATRKRLRRVVKHYGWYYLTHFVFRKKR